LWQAVDIAATVKSAHRKESRWDGREPAWIIRIMLTERSLWTALLKSRTGAGTRLD